MTQVFNVPTQLGSFRDTVSWTILTNNNIVINPSEKWLAGDYNWSSAYLKYTVANFRSSDQSWTIVVAIKTTSTAIGRFVASSDEWGGGTFLIFDMQADWTVRITTSSGTAYSITETVNDGQWHFIAVSSDWTNYKMYLDWAFKTFTTTTGQDGEWFADVANRDNLTVGADEGGSVWWYFDWYIGWVRIFDTQLSELEHANLYAQFLTLSNIIPPKRWFRDSSENITNTTDLICGYQFAWIRPSKTLDITGSNNLTVISAPVFADDWLVFDWTDDYLSLGNASDVNFNATDDFSVEAFLKLWTASWAQQIFSKRGWTDGYEIWLDASGGPSRYMKEWANEAYDTDDAGDIDDWLMHYVVFTFNRTSNQVTRYVDWVQVGTVDGFASVGSTANSEDALIWARDGWADQFFDWTMRSVKVSSWVLTATEIGNTRNKFANQVIINDNFEWNWADWTSKTPVGWWKWTWTYKVMEHSVAVAWIANAWDKFLQCTWAWTMAIPSSDAYWTWEWEVYKGADANATRTRFVSDLITWWSPWRYSLNIEQSEEIVFGVDASVESQTANSFVSINTWYGFKVTRTPAWVFTTYIKWWSFGVEYVLIDVSWGSWTNPATSTSNTTSNYYVIDYDVWDRYSDLIIKKWVTV